MARHGAADATDRGGPRHTAPAGDPRGPRPAKLRRGRAALSTAGLLLALPLALGACGGDTEVRDFLLVPHRPNLLAVIDAAARSIEAIHEIPGPGPPSTVAVSPDGRTAYILTNGNRSLVGLDIGSGDLVFRSDFDSDLLRVTAPAPLAVSPDGTELFVYQFPVERHPDRYRVQPTRIAVYSAAAGIGAEPLRHFPAPRRTSILAPAPDGSRLYTISWDIAVLDPADGRELAQIPFYHWERDGLSPPDHFDLWPAFEQSDVWAVPYVTLRGEQPLFGIASLDLASGDFRTMDVGPAGTVVFSVVVNPVRRNEAYGVYNHLIKFDREGGAELQRIDLPHTYYNVNVSTDGSELYVGGTMSDIAIYDTENLRSLGHIELPSGNDQGISTLRVVRRATAP